MFLTLKIKNWATHNPRADYKTMPWFKCSSRFYRSKKLFGLSSEVKWVCLSLFCVAAEENKGGLIEAELDWLADQIKIAPALLSESIELLVSRGLIALPYATRTADVRDTSCPRTGHGPYEENEENEEKSTPQLETPPSGGAPIPSGLEVIDLELAHAWGEFAQSQSRSTKPSPKKWSNTVRLLREKDGLSHEELWSMLEFVKNDEFWRPNAISIEGLRTKSKNGLKKFENILTAMQQRPQKKSRPLHLNPIAENLEDFDAEHS